MCSDYLFTLSNLPYIIQNFVWQYFEFFFDFSHQRLKNFIPFCPKVQKSYPLRATKMSLLQADLASL